MAKQYVTQTVYLNPKLGILLYIFLAAEKPNEI